MTKRIEILKTMADAAGPMKSMEISIESGVTINTVGTVLAQLRQRGFVESDRPPSGKGMNWEITRHGRLYLVNPEVYGEKPGQTIPTPPRQKLVDTDKVYAKGKNYTDVPKAKLRQERVYAVEIRVPA